MKNSKKTFFRSLLLSTVIMLCLLLGSYGIAKAYENTVLLGFGEYKKAVALTENGIRILDFEIDFKDTPSDSPSQ